MRSEFSVLNKFFSFYKLSVFSFEAQKCCFVSNLRFAIYFFVNDHFRNVLWRLPNVSNSILKVITLFRCAQCSSYQSYTRQSKFDVAQRCKYQCWCTQHCFIVDDRCTTSRGYIKLRITLKKRSNVLLGVIFCNNWCQARNIAL